jgi:pimeloyl-ACP methyl ester carboxylesterase
MSSGSFAGGVCEAREAMNRLIKILFLTTNPVNASKFHAETFGHPTGKMLVILHGGPGGDYRSLLNCKQFADHGYYVVFYDQRGSGLGWNLKLRKLAE